jgi:hypothetical protein
MKKIKVLKRKQMVEENEVCKCSLEPEVESQDGSLEDENVDKDDGDDSENEDEQDSETEEEFEIRKETALKQASVAHAKQ